MPITQWFRWDETKEKYLFNHIEDGHIESSKPTAKFPNQVSAWKNFEWKKEFSYLVDNKIGG